MMVWERGAFMREIYPKIGHKKKLLVLSHLDLLKKVNSECS
jgi:hypothetical protein